MKRTRRIILFLIWLLIAIFLLVFLLANYSDTSVSIIVNLLRAFQTVSESASGVIVGVLINVLSALFAEYAVKTISVKFEKFIEPINEKIVKYVIFIQNKISIFVNNVLNKLGTQVSKIILDLSTFIQEIISALWVFIVSTIKFIIKPIIVLIQNLQAPKWYHQSDSIDPGLVEVSLAITAVLIALPSFFSSNIPVEQAKTVEWFRFLGEAIPTLTSIGLLNQYSKNKGSTSFHILLSPIKDGPFFFLGWSIVIGFIFIAAVAFQVNL